MRKHEPKLDSAGDDLGRAALFCPGTQDAHETVMTARLSVIRERSYESSETELRERVGLVPSGIPALGAFFSAFFFWFDAFWRA